MHDNEEQIRKRAIFEAMSPRRQQKILKKGYETWNPFLPPKEPSRFYRTLTPEQEKEAREIDTRFNAFLKAHPGHGYSKEYVSGAKEICLGLHRGEQRYKGMFAFCCWMAARMGSQK
jgi:hypothetical protein